MIASDRALRLVHPPVIEIGPGTVATVGAWAKARGCRRPLVVADAFNVGRVDQLALDGQVTVFGEVVPEPDIANLEQVLAVASAAAADLVVGFGGGSAMDLAKLAAVLPGSGQTIRDVVGVGRTRGRGCALIQVPTTAGTGSEGGIRALVTDPATQNKLAVESIDMLADLAVVDPDLTMSVPPAVTAATGIDAMAHCVEAFTNRKAHPLIDLYAMEGIRLVGRYLARAVGDGSDREARGGLAVASLYGGFCLGPVNTAGGHALAYPLGTRHHVPHGAANALIFPHVLAFNAPVVPDKTRRVLAALGLPETNAEDAVREASHRFCAALGIEMRLSRLGIPASDLPVMADEAFAIRRLLDNNPRELSREDILAIYRNAY
ncbi:MAG: iron-containing alcohol dehydrogenase [Rhodoplanes sp.]|uniref:iron-containing alcohol dehydrogenase n=1 Tax=Rhodoplanes sp. TaxID=1968906 RepID=UPI0017D603E1|nr:iron-containing alcohol dehydrogenase [Rhodoplanes sp.]NVO15844.1 iron-containing alcohol dehydrogenase [Rhodoplanes sp.]